ncbi:MAG: iron-containing alcohol dehydrogenase [Clostridia bacterium]|nr:iron-containing alcohol dehydrogenase [Clostridia bacterium]
MLNNFEFDLHTHFVFGKDAEKSIGKALKARGAQNVLVVYGGSTVVKSGLLDAVCGYLEAEDIRVVRCGGVKPNPVLSFVREAVETAKKEQIDFIVAVGGGSVIDVCKAIGLGALYEGDVWDFYAHKLPPVNTLPVAAVLTYPATGSESSTNTVVTNEETMEKAGCGSEAIRPVLAFMNPELTYSLPPYLTACGVVDIFSHVVERYFTNNENFGIMDYLCESVFRALVDFGPKVMANPNDYDTRAEIMWIGTVAHDNALGLGRAQDWASHGIGHELSAHYDMAHGATLSIIIPAWMTYVHKARLGRFVRYAKEVFGITAETPEAAALAGIEATKAFFKSLDMPTSFKEGNLPTDKLDFMAEQAVKMNGRPLGCFMPLDVEDIKAIYTLAL